jgi:hypothetical protein
VLAYTFKLFGFLIFRISASPGEGYSRHVPGEGYSRHVPGEGYSRNLSGEGYPRNASCAINSEGSKADLSSLDNTTYEKHLSKAIVQMFLSCFLYNYIIIIKKI